MRKPLFYFICVFFLSLAVYPWLNTLSTELIDKVMIALIFVLGVPHGAIDNILMKRRTGWSSSRFYLFYFGLILINIGLWFVFPALSLFFFLGISAYHFGQAQLRHQFKADRLINPLLYLNWGNLVLGFFFLFRRAEIESYFLDFQAYEAIEFMFRAENLQAFLYTNAAVFLALCVMSYLREKVALRALGIEALILFMLMGIAYLYHFIVGFAIFFVLLHAMPVILEEYEEFYPNFKWQTFSKFLKMLSPFSLLSLSGIIFLFALKEYRLIEISYLFLILLATSSITLPHVWVMKKFYKE